MAVAAAARARSEVEFQIGVSGVGFGHGGDGFGGEERAAEICMHHHAGGVDDPAKMGPCLRGDVSDEQRAQKRRVELGRFGQTSVPDVRAQAVEKGGHGLSNQGPGQAGETRLVGQLGQHGVHGREQTEKMMHESISRKEVTAQTIVEGIAANFVRGNRSIGAGAFGRGGGGIAPPPPVAWTIRPGRVVPTGAPRGPYP